MSDQIKISSGEDIHVRVELNIQMKEVADDGVDVQIRRGCGVGTYVVYVDNRIRAFMQTCGRTMDDFRATTLKTCRSFGGMRLAVVTSSRLHFPHARRNAIV